MVRQLNNHDENHIVQHRYMVLIKNQFRLMYKSFSNILLKLLSKESEL